MPTLCDEARCLIGSLGLGHPFRFGNQDCPTLVSAYFAETGWATLLGNDTEAGGPAFDLAGTSGTEDAPSFALFAKVGSDAVCSAGFGLNDCSGLAFACTT